MGISQAMEDIPLNEMGSPTQARSAELGTPRDEAVRSMNADISRVRKEVHAGKLAPGGGGKIRRKRGGGTQSSTSRARVGTQVQATRTNVWRQVDPENLSASAGRVWGVYDSDNNGVLDRHEIRLMVKDWIAAMPDICSVYFDDAISESALLADIEENANQMTDTVFKYADIDKDGFISKEEWV